MVFPTSIYFVFYLFFVCFRTNGEEKKNYQHSWTKPWQSSWTENCAKCVNIKKKKNQKDQLYVQVNKYGEYKSYSARNDIIGGYFFLKKKIYFQWQKYSLVRYTPQRAHINANVQLNLKSDGSNKIMDSKIENKYFFFS